MKPHNSTRKGTLDEIFIVRGPWLPLLKNSSFIPNNNRAQWEGTTYSPSTSHCLQLPTLLTWLVWVFFFPSGYLRKHKQPSQGDSPQWRGGMKWQETGCSTISNQVREKIIHSPELGKLVNNLSLVNPLLCHFLVSHPALILQILAPAPCTVYPSSSTSCFHQCPWKNSVMPAGILLSGWKPSKSRMCSRNFARC